MSYLRALMRIAINRLGYDIRRVPSASAVNFDARDCDPVTFEYLKPQHGFAVLEVPVSDARAFDALGLPLTEDQHPIVRAASQTRRHESDDAIRRIVTETLRDYYTMVQPSTAAEMYSLSDEDLPGLAENNITIGSEVFDPSFLPWGRPLHELIDGRQRWRRHEGLENGIIAGVEDGLTDFGPISANKLAMEVNRTVRLAKSVKHRGFDSFDRRSPMQVSGLRRDGEYRWLIGSGQHRFATAAAFEIATLPAMVTNIIRREDAAYWPQVVSGYFSESGAVSLFDRIFDGTPPDACNEWISTARS